MCGKDEQLKERKKSWYGSTTERKGEDLDMYTAKTTKSQSEMRVLLTERNQLKQKKKGKIPLKFSPVIPFLPSWEKRDSNGSHSR